MKTAGKKKQKMRSIGTRFTRVNCTMGVIGTADVEKKSEPGKGVWYAGWRKERGETAFRERERSHQSLVRPACAAIERAL